MEENQFNDFSEIKQTQSNVSEIMTVKDWLITLIVLAIPCVNIVMYIIWAMNDTNENRKNFCRAGLIMLAISVVLSSIVFFFSIGASMFAII